MNANLECCYVARQRGFVSSGFSLQDWLKASLDGVSFPGDVREYAVVLEDFNKAFNDARVFEGFYLSGPQHRTRANAEVLNAKKELLEQKIPAIPPVILAAQQALRVIMENP